MSETSELRAFVKDCAENWDCDTGANGDHPYYCRQCRAKKLLADYAATTMAGAGLSDDIARAHAALKAVPNARVEETSMKVALWALGAIAASRRETEQARAKVAELHKSVFDMSESLQRDEMRLDNLVGERDAARAARDREVAALREQIAEREAADAARLNRGLYHLIHCEKCKGNREHCPECHERYERMKFTHTPGDERRED